MPYGLIVHPRFDRPSDTPLMHDGVSNMMSADDNGLKAGEPSPAPNAPPDLGPVLHLIVPHCDPNTLHALLRTCNFLRQEVIGDIRRRGGGVLSIEAGRRGWEVKSWSFLLPWFHPDSPMQPKITTLQRCKQLRIDFSAIQGMQHLLVHLPRSCCLHVNDFPTAMSSFSDHSSQVVLPPVDRLHLRLDLGLKYDFSLETVPIEHSAQCVEVELNLDALFLEHWLVLPAFVGPSTRCFHVRCYGDTWFDIPQKDHLILPSGPPFKRLNIFTLFTDSEYGFGSPSPRARERVGEALRRVFRTTDNVVDAGADGAAGGRLCSLPDPSAWRG